jgi:hypothetical protein
MNKIANNEKWMKASVAGSLWAAFEIVIGSFLHNLHFPFTGLVMASVSVILMTSFSVLWEMKDIFWRAGLVCALMKSISPSAVILGPMMGILLESILMQLLILMLGRNIFGYILGGVFAILSLLLHKVISLIITYGFDFVVLLENTAAFILKTFSIKSLTPLSLLYWYAGILVLVGLAASLTGYFIGKKAVTEEVRPLNSFEVSDGNIKRYKESQSKGIFYMVLTIAILVFGMLLISNYNILLSSVYILIFILLSSIFYPEGLKPFGKSSVILNFLILILFSIFFFDYTHSGIRWSDEGFAAGIRMIFRAVLILGGFTIISIELRNPIIKNLIHEKSAVYGAIKAGFSILPSIISGFPSAKEMITKPVQTISLRVAEADYFINNNILKHETNNN